MAQWRDDRSAMCRGSVASRGSMRTEATAASRAVASTRPWCIIFSALAYAGRAWLSERAAACLSRICRPWGHSRLHPRRRPRPSASQTPYGSRGARALLAVSLGRLRVLPTHRTRHTQHNSHAPRYASLYILHTNGLNLRAPGRLGRPKRTRAQEKRPATEDLGLRGENIKWKAAHRTKQLVRDDRLRRRCRFENEIPTRRTDDEHFDYDMLKNSSLISTTTTMTKAICAWAGERTRLSSRRACFEDRDLYDAPSIGRSLHDVDELHQTKLKGPPPK